MPRAEPSSAVRPQGSGGALVEVQDLGWRPFGRSRPVFDGLSLRIEPGQRVLLAGPSGSGKSSLLRALAGVLTSVDSGELTGSVEIRATDPRGYDATIGLLVQDPADATVADRVGRDVAFGLENQGTPREDIWARVRRALAAVRFPYGTGHLVNALSGGQAQKLALAGVLVLEPELVLLDEPSSMLDPAAAAAVREAIWSALADSVATVVLVEHRLAPWLPEIDRVVVLAPDGTIAADGTVAETLLADAGRFAEQGLWVPGVPAPIPLDVPTTLCTPMNVSRDVEGVLVRADSVGVQRDWGMELGGRGAGRTVQTLSEVDAVVHAGEIVALVGSSGAGKSTLAALLAGLEPPSTGTVTAGERFGEGLDPSPARWRSIDLARRVGWVPQNPELAVVGRTVREDVLGASKLLELDGLASRVDGLLELLGLEESAETDPHHLSGGQLRRLALAGALAHGPGLLVLDEPTVGQDRQTWAVVAGVILAARNAGVAVVVATHDPLVIALADRCIRLEHGRVVDEGTSEVAPPPAEVFPPSASNSRRDFLPLVQRCGPLSLFGASALLLAGALSIVDLTQALLGVAAEFALAPAVLGLRGHHLRRMLPGLLAVVSVGFSTWLLSTGQNPVVAATAGLRIAFFVLPGVMLVSFIDPFALGDHLAQRLRLPVRPVVAAVAALQRFQSLGEQWGKLRRIRRVRGIDTAQSPAARGRQLAALTFALLVQSLRQAERMAVAMEARGFSSALAHKRKRSWAEPAPWLPADTVLTALAAIVAALPAVLAITA